MRPVRVHGGGGKVTVPAAVGFAALRQQAKSWYSAARSRVDVTG